MRTLLGRVAVAAVLSVFILGSSALRAEDEKKPDTADTQEAQDVMIKPGELKWADGPPSLPAGVKFAVMEGDPMKEGPFTMRLKLPAGYKIPPHWHPGIEHVTIISGIFNVGKGEKEDTSKANALPQGSFFIMAPRSPHFAFTKEETILQLHGTGPWGINYVNPADDPRKK